jgi:hypothetical protein
MRQSRSYGSVRGAISDGRPYRNTWPPIAITKCGKAAGMTSNIYLDGPDDSGLIRLHNYGLSEARELRKAN